MTIRELLTDSLYLLALINPISKIAILSVFTAKEDQHVVPRAALTSTAVAAGILLAVILTGDFIFRTVFHVELYSVRIAGGAVLFWVGFHALAKGVFFEADTHKRHFTELSIVPLASPMIAGPGTIAAALGLALQHGILATSTAMLVALGANLLLMLAAQPIGDVLRRHNIMGALIRITGLVVAAIAVQMVLDGMREWWKLPG
jgi:multiple antibiotic resistance protein